MTHFAFARQPILNKSLELYAYEFLYRTADSATNDAADNSRQSSHSLTSELLTSIIIDTGLKEATNHYLAFINMSYQDLMGTHIEALPADKIILELLEDIKPNQELNKRIKELVKKGYTIALDDFVYSSEWDHLIDLATIIKLDLTVTTLEENKALIDKLHDKNITFLAEKVETYQQFHEYKDIGCTLFQGYFFCKPEKVSGKIIDTSSLARIRLISELNQPDITVDALEKMIQQHPKLTYNLLKYLNSGYFSFPQKLGSIKQCIITLGIEGMKSWSTILCLRNFSSKPAELRHMTLIRAKLAELLATKHKLANPTSYFLMGILSTLDALTDTSMENILKTMPLDNNIVDALLYQKGEMAHILATVIAHESVGNITAPSESSEAFRWADEIMQSFT